MPPHPCFAQEETGNAYVWRWALTLLILLSGSGCGGLRAQGPGVSAIAHRGSGPPAPVPPLRHAAKFPPPLSRAHTPLQNGTKDSVKKLVDLLNGFSVPGPDVVGAWGCWCARAMVGM